MYSTEHNVRTFREDNKRHNTLYCQVRASEGSASTAANSGVNKICYTEN